MGAPETEEGSRESERPQHEVTVPPFFMGKYTVTQAQAMPSATPRGLIISDIESFTNVNSGVVTDELKHELRFTVTLIKNGDKVKTFGVASRDNRLLPLRVSKAEQEKILLLSLQDAMKQVIPEIITFMSQT